MKKQTDVIKAFGTRGGIRAPHRKNTAEEESVLLPTPQSVAIPLQMHIGAPCTAIVKPGDSVLVGQKIADSDAFVSAPIHASVSGTVKEIRKITVAGGGLCDAIAIESDGAMAPVETAPPDVRDAASLANAARECGLVGLGGAGFPTHIKLRIPEGKRIDTLIVNVAECEPYLTADFRVMLEHADRVRTGVEIMRKVLNGPAVRIAIEANKPEAIAAMEKAFADIEGNVEIVVLPVLYPQGSEKHQIYATVKRIVPEGGLPIAVGCVVENIGTVAAIADAVTLGKPLIERVTTVTGDGVNRPKNVLAPCGTRYEDMIAFAGGAKDNVRKVLSGGPMMGFNVADMGISTTKTTSGLTLLTEKSVFQYSSHACINCGTCLRACPMNLNPAAISCAVESDDIAFAERYGVMNCIECGACSFSCPAYRDITQNCRRAKASIRTRIAREKAAAAAASEKRS